MIYRSKVFYLALIFCVFAVPHTAQAQEKKEKTRLYNTIKPVEESESSEDSQTKGRMQSMSWKAPEPEKPKDTAEPDKQAEPAEEELSEDQKLWEKYKELAAGKVNRTLQTARPKLKLNPQKKLKKNPSRSPLPRKSRKQRKKSKQPVYAVSLTLIKVRNKKKGK